MSFLIFLRLAILRKMSGKVSRVGHQILEENFCCGYDVLRQVVVKSTDTFVLNSSDIVFAPISPLDLKNSSLISNL